MIVEHDRRALAQFWAAVLGYEVLYAEDEKRSSCRRLGRVSAQPFEIVSLGVGDHDSSGHSPRPMFTRGRAEPDDPFDLGVVIVRFEVEAPQFSVILSTTRLESTLLITC